MTASADDDGAGVTAGHPAEGRRVAHVWLPFREASLYVDLPGGTGAEPCLRDLPSGAVARGEFTRDARYGEPLWRVDAGRLHAVVEAFWSAGIPVRVHLDQAPVAGNGQPARDG
jgi:hypothetical protein